MNGREAPSPLLARPAAAPYKSCQMPAVLLILLLPLASFAASLAATRAAMPLLGRFAMIDRPGPRSSHATPVPRGGGIGLLAGLLPSWGAAALLSGGVSMSIYVTVLAAAIGLATVSFLDDRKSLPAVPRLLAQLVAVSAVLAQMREADLIFQGLLPPLADRILAGLAWLWFINLFNFMDGIDGISGVEAAAIGIGTAITAWFAGTYQEIGCGLALAGAALGFLVWNWHPARLFLGDVGSIPLGFLSGWLLLRLAIDGNWAPALILPAYYLADATITLFARLARGEKIWQAHRSHFYQRAVQAGLRHDQVARRVAETNVMLILLSYFALSGQTLPALAGAVLVVGLRLHGLGKPAPQAV
jgi:UDP-N-acetylmuramyl pentapeptide phosphotransferase/UDP-N-acetylglucosamine-1-phosphate transferase